MMPKMLHQSTWCLKCSNRQHDVNNEASVSMMSTTMHSSWDIDEFPNKLSKFKNIWRRFRIRRLRAARHWGRVVEQWRSDREVWWGSRRVSGSPSTELYMDTVHREGRFLGWGRRYWERYWSRRWGSDRDDSLENKTKIRYKINIERKEETWCRGSVCNVFFICLSRRPRNPILHGPPIRPWERDPTSTLRSNDIERNVALRNVASRWMRHVMSYVLQLTLIQDFKILHAKDNRWSNLTDEFQQN